MILFGMSPAWLHPLWRVGIGVLIAVAALMAIGAIFRLLVPKVAAIARTTAKEAMSQPLFYLLLTIGVFGLILFPFIPYNTLGEDITALRSMEESKLFSRTGERDRVVAHDVIAADGAKADARVA